MYKKMVKNTRELVTIWILKYSLLSLLWNVQLVRKVRSSSNLNSSDSPLVCYCTHGICWRIHGDQSHLCASLKDWNERFTYTSFRWVKCFSLLGSLTCVCVCVCVYVCYYLLTYWLYTLPTFPRMCAMYKWLHRCSWCYLVELIDFWWKAIGLCR
jgi:hypothetical protein